MIYVILGIGLLFVAIGFLVTENNARYLLAGYNTMSEAERKKVDIRSYLAYFRKFHVFLGLSFLMVGLILYTLASKNAAGIFLGVYPIAAYMYLIATSAKYSRGRSTKWDKIGFLVLAGSLVLVIGLFVSGFRENRLVLSEDRIEFQGSYGEAIPPSEISTVELVGQLPEITLKTNGFALGTINKGYFKTREGEIVKLILNTDAKPYLLLTKADGKKIYFSSKTKPNEEIYNEMKQTLPGLVYKN